MEGQQPSPQQGDNNASPMQQQPNMMMYPPQGQQQQQPPGAPPQPNPTDPSQQQEQQPQPPFAQGGYPGGMYPPQMQFYGQGPPGYPQGMEGAPPAYNNDPRFPGFAQYPPPPQQQEGQPQGDQQQQQQPQQQSAQDYMNANQFLLARLQQQPGAWMAAPPMGYGMPPGMEGYTMGPEGMMAPWSSTSAGLLGKIGGGTEPKKKTIRKKHKDKPKRPLSAYNLFFRDERKKILESIPKKSEDDEEELDEDGKKIKKKPPHGKIGFENLAKIIGQRWQKLEPDRIEHYKKLASVDMKRYKEAMEVFLAKIEAEKKKKFEDENGFAEEEGDDDESGEPAAKKAKTEEQEGETESKEV